MSVVVDDVMAERLLQGMVSVAGGDVMAERLLQGMGVSGGR